MKKLLIIDTGALDFSSLEMIKKLKDKGIDVEIVPQNDVGKLTEFRTPEVKQLLSVIPEMVRSPPMNRRDRRKQNRLKKKKRR